MEWIPRGTLPTNDFVWLAKDGKEWELKSTKPKYSTIRNQIAPSVRDALKKAVKRNRFVVDLGRSKLTNKLRQQLTSYNQRNPNNTILELWVMHSGGRILEQVVLT